MCLKIDNRIKVQFDENGEAVLYKIVKKDFDGKKCFAIYYEAEYEIGKETLSNRDDEVVEQPGMISEGIHTILNLESVVNCVNYLQKLQRVYGGSSWSNSYVLIKCLCKEEDLIAEGVWWDCYDVKQAVFDKIVPLEELPFPYIVS